ncbi:hypothetical protein H7171_00755 [Candidatus Saccharibacteria bacterium]|nr:hypothetical protein [Candidatus Saccharibacteria bacterium]
MKHNQNGGLNVLLIPFIFAILFLLGAGGFGAWAYLSRQDYKLNTDKKVAAAVVLAKQQEGTSKDKEFVESEKKPLRVYTGPEPFGSLQLSYPKTWSGYVQDSGGDTYPINGYFYPAIIPSVIDPGSTYALRMQVINRKYTDVLQVYQSKVLTGKATVAPYNLPRVPSVIGVRIEGQVTDAKTGSMVILPLRDKVLEIWTEGTGYGKDFNENILPNVTFSP